MTMTLMLVNNDDIMMTLMNSTNITTKNESDSSGDGGDDVRDFDDKTTTITMSNKNDVTLMKNEP